MQLPDRIERTLAIPRMYDAALHAHLHAAALHAAVDRGGDPDLATLERHALAGCSPCARALVNGRERAVTLAALGSPVTPRAALRARVLATGARRQGAPPAAPTSPLRDPSATVAHLHLDGEDEPARRAEVDALDALSERPGDGTARALSQLTKLIDFPILFVSIVRGERIGYRVQRGFEGAGPDARHMRREMTFCTHCVSGAAPLVVEDAAAEPFFRGSKMVRRFGIRAYVGVPLRTSSDVIVGTLCALDGVRRKVDPEVVRLLELFAEPVAAAIEMPRSTARRDALLEGRAGGIAVYGRSWFGRLLDLELARAARGRPVALVALPQQASGSSAADATLAALAKKDEVLGLLGAPHGPEGALGLLLSGTDEPAAAARRAALEQALPPTRYAVAEGSPGGARPTFVWRDGSAGRGIPA